MMPMTIETEQEDLCAITVHKINPGRANSRRYVP